MEVEIIKLDNLGRGIAYINNLITFVYNALPGEIVKIKIVRETKKYNEAIVTKYLKSSLDRVVVKCPYFNECGGCDLEHLSYNKTCEFKKDTLAKVLQKYANITKEINFYANDNSYNYRNKLSLKALNKQIGFYENKSNKLVNITYCYLAKESINKIIPYLHIKNGDIIIRSNYNDEIMISINSQDQFTLDINSLTKENKIIGIIYNNKIVYGEDHFIERVNHKLFNVHLNSFFQINLNIASKVIQLMKSKVNKDDIVLDLYCGVGFLGLSLADLVKEVYGVEENVNAVKDALLNTKINKIPNAKFILGKSENTLNHLPKDINTVIVDPPRAGLKPNVINYLNSNPNIKKIIYMSCDIFSLARDLKELKKQFEIEEINAFDMFPNTHHIESLVILKRN